MMTKEAGDPRFPIWLLADSEPVRWSKHLEAPLDRRHPIRHNIWTSVLDLIQSEVYLALGERLDADWMYVRNAVQDPATKPSKPFNTMISWGAAAQAALEEYRGLLDEYRPRIVLTFGWFAFAFGLRAIDKAQPGPTARGSKSALLGNEFRSRVKDFDIDRTNVLPLLHRSIAGVNFLAGHDEFCGTKGGNCFDDAGEAIAKILVRCHDQFDCWVKRSAGLAVTLNK
jgi:hypothetical protein